MAKLWMGPAGNLIEGHVLDVARKPFERALKDYDPQLYVKWNPKKLRGHGCYEIRRKPESTTIVDYAEVGSTVYFKLGYIENNLIAHVLDCAFLNYDQLRKIQEMDTFKLGPQQWIADRDYTLKQQTDARKAKARQEMAYEAKQYKRELRDFKEFVLSGNNPHQIMAHWDDK